MKFTTDALVNGTSYKGEINITYSELVSIFGKPTSGPNSDLDKVTCEWCLEYEDGTIATLYDWKTGHTPFGPYAWHIGGHDYTAVERVLETIELSRDPLVKMVKEYKVSE